MFKTNKKYFFDFLKKPNDSFFINSFIDYNIDIFRIINENHGWGISTIATTTSGFILYGLISNSINNTKMDIKWNNRPYIKDLYSKIIKNDYNIDKKIYRFNQIEDTFYKKNYINPKFIINQVIFYFIFLNNFKALSYIFHNENDFENLNNNFLFLNGFMGNDTTYQLTSITICLLSYIYFKSSPNPLYFRLNKNISNKTNYFWFSFCFVYSLPMYLMPNGYFISFSTIIFYKILINYYKLYQLKLKLKILDRSIKNNINKIKKYIK